ALAVSYYNSVAFQSMKPSTQSVYRNIIERFCRETDKEGHEHGDKRAATLQREHIVKLMAARAQKPDSANGLRKAVRAMMKHGNRRASIAGQMPKSPDLRIGIPSARARASRSRCCSREVSRYTKAADQKRLAAAAMEKVKARTSS